MIGPVPFSLHLEGLDWGEPGTPTFARLAELISLEIRRGRLRPGDRLPGTRPLAAELGLGRNTVVAAYAELAAEGWISTRPAGGSFVSAALPEPKTRRFAKAAASASVASTPGFEFEPRSVERTPEPSSMFALHAGVPDLRAFPTVALARAYRRALRGRGRATLDYTTPFGNARLRAALASMISATRALAVDEERILVTHGSQMALDLLARTLIRPGDQVAVEELGYQPAWDALRNAGAKLRFFPVDKQGFAVEMLEKAVSAGERLRAVYLSPHHQYPTTASLSVARRLRLLELAAKQRMIVIEDDYDHEFHYDGRPLASLAGADRAGVVVYVGTLAKILAPGLRLGFVAAPRALIETLAAARMSVDRHGDSVIEQAVAELIEEGELGRHARRMRRIYHARRDAFAEQLTKHLGDALRFDVPAGGMAFWANAAADIDTQRWLERARRRGVAFATGKSYSAPELGPKKAREYGQCLRLCFARYNESELSTAVKRMASALTGK